MIIAGAAALPCLTDARPPQQESVAEAARKVRAQKKASVKHARVVTDEDLLRATIQRPDSLSSSTGPAGPADQSQKTGAVQPTQTADSDAKREKAWRQRFAEAYNKLHAAEAELNVLQREWNKGQVEYYSDPQKALKEQYTRKDINEHSQKIEIKKKEIEQLRQTIASMEDELRQSGGDPGWARQP
jgi:predicted RNase H-like nuclease (RuvC/YqgF family)